MFAFPRANPPPTDPLHPIRGACYTPPFSLLPHSSTASNAVLKWHSRRALRTRVSWGVRDISRSWTFGAKQIQFPVRIRYRVQLLPIAAAAVATHPRVVLGDARSGDTSFPAPPYTHPAPPVHPSCTTRTFRIGHFVHRTVIARYPSPICHVGVNTYFLAVPQCPCRTHVSEPR